MSATKAPTSPEIGEAQRRLDVFVGKWHTEGTSFADGQKPDDPRASGVSWTSDEHVEATLHLTDFGTGWCFRCRHDSPFASCVVVVSMERGTNPDWRGQLIFSANDTMISSGPRT